MVEALIYHLPGHFGTVGIELRIGSKAIDYRNLNACKDSKTVTFGIHQRILWIMGDAEEIASHFLEQTYIPQMHLVGKGIPKVLVILMPVGSHEFEVPPIQEEALIRIEAK